jgi:hypothetical protein
MWLERPPMSMFEFDPTAHARAFANDGYVHIPRGITPEFYTLLSAQVQEYLQTHRLKDYLVGDKKQAVYQLPEGDRYLNELLETIGAICGLDPEQLLLSERHIKVYDADAKPYPLAHKDRFASQISVGISVDVPEGSTLVLYPYDHLEVNSFNSSTELRASFAPERAPETYLRDARRVEIADKPGDVVVFRGHKIWHLREHPANTTMVYLKLNVMNCDPLGEDRLTQERRDATMRLVETADEEFAGLLPLIGRRVDYFHRRYDRNWQEVIGVVLWGQPHKTIDEHELRILQAIDGRSPVRAVLATALGASRSRTACDVMRSLAARGIVDLLPAVQAPDTAKPRAEPALAR